MTDHLSLTEIFGVRNDMPLWITILSFHYKKVIIVYMKPLVHWTSGYAALKDGELSGCGLITLIKVIKGQIHFKPRCTSVRRGLRVALSSVLVIHGSLHALSQDCISLRLEGLGSLLC